MDIERAKALLAVLADGVNPITGEVLPAGDSCNQGEIVRALYTVLGVLNAQEDETGKKQPKNAGTPWSEEDDKVLCEMFDNGATRKELSAHFQRTSGAIAARLVKLGKINTRAEI